jgi:hypothetical protein
LAVLALGPATAWAAEAPEIFSISPPEIGSNGGQRIIIHGAKFTPTSVVHYAEFALKRKVTGTPAKGESITLSPTEIEFIPPFREHGKRPVQVCNLEPPPEACSNTVVLTSVPEVYKNEAAVSAARVPITGIGQILLNSPQINTQIECENMGFGSAWNEAPTEKTGPISAHAEILVWAAGGHTPKSPDTELSSRCRFVYHGVEENQPTSPIAWPSAEPPLHEVIQEAELCIAKVQKPSECPAATERETQTVIREVNREGLSLPWNIQITEKSERPRVRIGLPEECSRSEPSERTELIKCGEHSEREPGTNPERCNFPPDPPGCVKVQILSTPPLNLHMEYEGYVEPLFINSGPSGLSPSSWEFEGSAAGEPALHLRETPTTEGSVTGNFRIRGLSGQELMTVR